MHFFLGLLVYQLSDLSFTASQSVTEPWSLLGEIVTAQPILQGTDNGTRINQEFMDLAYQTAQDVATLHRNGRSPPYDGFPVPTLPLWDAKFAHAYTFDSGIANREDVYIGSLREEKVLGDLNGVRSWRHIRFNYADVLLAMSERRVIIWRRNLIEQSPFDLRERSAFAVLNTESGLVDCNFFVKGTDNAEKLYLSLAFSNQMHSVVKVYRVAYDSLKPLPILNFDGPIVKLSTSEVRGDTAMLALVASPYHLEPVTSTHVETDLVDVKVVRVMVANPVDMISFVANGHRFLAVANGSLCHIFVTDDMINFLEFDRISIQDIVDLETFRIGADVYLIIAGSYHQLVFHVDKYAMVPKQEFLIPGLSRATIFYASTYRDDVSLLVSRDASQSCLFYNWRNRLESFEAVPEHVLPPFFRPVPGTPVSFSHNQTVYLAIVDRDNGRPRVFSVQQVALPLPNPTLVKGNMISEAMEDLEKRLRKFEKDAEYLKLVLSKSVKAYQHITGNHVLSNLLLDLPDTKITTRNLGDVGSIFWHGSPLTKDGSDQGLPDLRRHLQELELETLKLEETLEDLVMKDSNAVITGHKIIHGFSSPLMRFTALDFPVTGGLDVKKAISETFRLNRPQLRLGNIIVNGDLFVTGNLDTATVNGLNLANDVFLTSVPQHYPGTLRFAQPLKVAGDLSIGSGRIGALQLDQVIPIYGEHYFPSRLTFGSPVFVHELISPLVDGVDLTLLSRTALRKGQKQTLVIQAPIQFPPQFSSLVVTGTINGVDVTALGKSLVRGNRPNKLGHTIFHDAAFEGGLFVGGRYDGLRVPDSIFLPQHSSIVASKHFAKATFRDAVYVDGLIDGLKLPESVVPLTKDEVLPFPLAFAKGFDVEKDLLVTGLVDGVDPKELLSRASKTTPTSGLKGKAVFLGPVVVERHFVVVRPSDQLLQAIRNDLIFPEDEHIVMTGRKHFPSLTSPAVDLRGTVNGYNIQEDFLHREKDQVVLGRKIFKSPVTFHQHLYTGKNTVDGVNIVELYHNRVSLERDSTLAGSLTFFDTVFIDKELIVSGTVDGLKFPQDFVLRDSAELQTMTGKTFLKRVNAKDVVLAGDLMVSNLLDGVPINDFIHRRVTLSTPQALSGVFTIGAGNRVDDLETALMNGKDCSSLSTDFVSLSRPQTVNANVFIWSGDTNVFGDIVTSHGINGVKFNELKDHVMKLNSMGQVSPRLVFEEGLTVQGNLEVGSLNGADFNQLYHTALKKSTGGVLTGNNRFLAPVNVAGDIVAGLVNGLVLGETLLLKHGHQTVLGKYTFNRLDVAGHFVPARLVNGLDISEFEHSVLRPDKDNTVNGNLHFTQPLTVSGDVDVTGLTNRVDLEAMSNQAIWQRGIGLEQLVPGYKIINGPVTVEGDFLVGLFNDVDLPSTMADIVMVNQDGIVAAPKTFAQGLLVPNGNLFVSGELIASGLVSGVNVGAWKDFAAFADQPFTFTGETIFRGNLRLEGSVVDISGTINGVKFPDDVIVINTDQPQIVYGVKEFEHLTVASDVEVGGLVNHKYHLPSLAVDTFLVHGHQTITGHKRIEGVIVFDDDVYGHVNNVNFAEETISLHQPGELIFDGRIVFDGALFINGNLSTTGLVCQVDLPDLAATAVYTDHEQVISNNLHFQDATFHDVIVGGLVAGLDLTPFHNELVNLKNEAYESTDSLIKHNRDIDRAVNYLEEVASRSPSYLDHVHFHQGLNSSGYPVSSSVNRMRLVASEKETTVVTTYVQDITGRFVVETVEKKLMVLVSAVQMGYRTLFLWSDLKGHGILGEGQVIYGNFSGFVHGDLKALTPDLLLVAVLREDSCELLEMMLHPQTDVPTPRSSITIPNLRNPVSVHILMTSTKIYVAIDVSTTSNSFEVCVRDPESGVLIYIWDLPRKTAIYFQRLEGASQHLAGFERSGMHYLAKSDAYAGNRNPKTEIKFFRRDDRLEEKFEYAYSINIPNVAAFEYFEMEDGYQYLGVVNGTHLTLGHLAESHGGFYAHTVIPCRQAYSVRKVLASDGHAYLAVGQGHSLTKNKGRVNLYRLSWSSHGLGKPTA